jgi:hypothetical protein
LAVACGDGGTGPGHPQVGPIGPFPLGLTGKLAFVIAGVVTTSAGAQTEAKVHVVDVASATDHVIYTGAANVSIEGLAWAPDGQHLVVQTFLFQLDQDGNNRSIWQLHSLNASGTEDRIIFGSSAPEYHPAYSASGRLAYFAGWSDDPAAGIYIDGGPILPVLSSGASYLSWVPDGSAIVYSGQGTGLQELRLADNTVTQLVPPEGEEVIQEPAVSPDGALIAMLRFGGTRQLQEIWTATASGSGA